MASSNLGIEARIMSLLENRQYQDITFTKLILELDCEKGKLLEGLHTLEFLNYVVLDLKEGDKTENMIVKAGSACDELKSPSSP